MLKHILFCILKVWKELLIHHDLRGLIEAHVSITDQSFGMRGKHFVICARSQERISFVSEPFQYIRNRSHLRNVVAIAFT
jgi:hypothetical protein